jgi:hypothetical protein
VGGTVEETGIRIEVQMMLSPCKKRFRINKS